MSLRIRQVVLAARDLGTIVEQLQTVLGVAVCYRDPEVAHFGLENALFTIGHEDGVQFLEVVSPVREDTTAGRHIGRHGDSGYMLILQTDDLARDRERLRELGVRIVWEAAHADISAVHLHPKDIGAAIVSLDQATPYDSWRWAGPGWQQHVNQTGAQRVTAVNIAARDPAAMMQRWAKVLGVDVEARSSAREPRVPNHRSGAPRIDIKDGALKFEAASADVIAGFEVVVPDRQAAIARARALGVPVEGNSIVLCGARFALLG